MKHLEQLKKRIGKYFKKSKLNKIETSYVKTLSTILSTIGNAKAQRLLVKGLKFKALRFNTLVSITSLKKNLSKKF